jgi:predicted pyridoxine 5'-phosphate oxidase superfamily flavin-nucleotide-binding protein
MTTPPPRRTADAGFHAGETAVQQRAGVQREAARLAPMVGPARLSAGITGFLAERTFLVVTGRDAAGRLWTSPLVGPRGFLRVRSATQLAVHAAIAPGDPLHGIAAGQKMGLTAVEFAARRRVRLNGELVEAAGGVLLVDVEQAYGNCPQFIAQRLLAPDDPGDRPHDDDVRRGTTVEPEDAALIRASDTFFLGTVHPERGADASHRGGPPGFVRVEGNELWWPDYQGNNIFNSLGNITVDPEAALLFLDFATGRTLHLSGTAAIEWGEPGRPGDDDATGRIVRFSVRHVVAGRSLPAREVAHQPYPHHPALTE